MALLNRPLRVLAFEGWDAGSHHQVRRSLSEHSRHQWTWVTRPGRAWKWRLRVGAIELIEIATQQGHFDDVPDVLFVTSMVAAGDLRSLLPAALRSVPMVLYMHENQAAYPFRHGSQLEEARDHQFALTNLTSGLSVDRILWNSAWNRDSFCVSMQELLSKSPDCTCRDACDRILERSRICWPPVECLNVLSGDVLHNTPETDNSGPSNSGAQAGSEVGAKQDGCIRIVWPHRWEHDKGPDTLLRLARFLKHREPGRYRWTLLGEQFRTIPDSLEQFQDEFQDDIDHAGWVDSRDTYWSHLGRCDWVLSTARHEFFGIAVVEAMLAGCMPWLPGRLSYPEILPVEARGLSPSKPMPDEAGVREAITKQLQGVSPEVAVTAIDQQLEDLASSNPPC